MMRSQIGWTLLVFWLLPLVLSAAVGRTQEEIETPSQKTKEAVERLKKAPEAVGKSLEALKEAGAAKLQEMLGGKEPAKTDSDPLALPERKPVQSETPRYSAEGKRDPFQPMDLKPKASRRPRKNLSPLERYELGQLKLVGIVWDIKEPRAMVEDSVGLGYIVKVGTPIGASEGKVKAIKPSEVVIEEIQTDFFGNRKKRETTMKLPRE
jgi:Tfp pilus assembly protein PilP